jgi:hypothetical protein
MMNQAERTLADILELASNSDLLQSQDWDAIAAEAVGGCAPAQYIVAEAFARRGELGCARQWYRRSAKQHYGPALSKLAQLKRGSAA